MLPAADSRGDAWTYVFRRDETYAHIDHILVSPGLRAAVSDGVARIFDGDGVRTASDHRPVVIKLVLDAKK